MPRRRANADPPMDESTMLALPPPRVVTHAHKHEHERDPYESPPGAVPARVTNARTTQQAPLKRRMTREDLSKREAAREDMRVRSNRYLRYLDLLRANGGDKISALAAIYSVSLEQAHERQYELHLDVRTGMGGTDLAGVLEANDLALTDRVALLRSHAYSDNPAASLKALDMAQDLEGSGGGQGSFESFLRLIKTQKGR